MNNHDVEPVGPGDDPTEIRTFGGLLTGHLPLQNETTFFILFNTLDIFLTYLLLRYGAIEANPFANYVLVRWGFLGMIGFKLIIVAAVCVIAQVVALRSLWKAKALLWFGTALVGAVVVYSALLFFSQSQGKLPEI